MVDHIYVSKRGIHGMCSKKSDEQYRRFAIEQDGNPNSGFPALNGN